MGLIPTGVGNTPYTSSRSALTWAHPHGCGEHMSVQASRSPTLGSSPRVWGTQRFGLGRAGRGGLIPTGVGNTQHLTRESRLTEAHPHGCGEHKLSIEDTSAYSGSSPRVWGTRRKRGRYTRLRGLIPTGVGNTRRLRYRRSRHGAHPHGCGEHAGCGRCRQVTGGSSPRVWGTPITAESGVIGSRLIPTGVGNTHPRHLESWHVWAHPHGCGEHALTPSRS